MPHGHQTSGSQLTATDGVLVPILTFPLAEGQTEVVSVRLVLRAQDAGARYVYGVTSIASATRQAGQAGAVDSNDGTVTFTRSGAGSLAATVNLTGGTVSAGVVTLSALVTVTGGTPTAMTLQAQFDSLPAGAVVL